MAGGDCSPTRPDVFPKRGDESPTIGGATITAMMALIKRYAALDTPTRFVQSNPLSLIVFSTKRETVRLPYVINILA